jgi:hypothetical protein
MKNPPMLVEQGHDKSTIIRQCPADTPIPIPETFPGYMLNQELVWLYETASALERVGVTGSILEIGSYKGLSTSALGQAGHVVCIDTFEDSLGKTDTEAEFRENIKPFVDSYEVLRGRSEDMLKKLTDRTFRLVLIDGGHDFETALGDIAGAWPLLSPGGIVVVDDYFPPSWFPGVKAACDYLGLKEARLVNPFYSKMAYAQKPV